MLPFTLHMPTRIVFGAGRLVELGHHAAEVGGAAMLVIGGGSMHRIGAVARAERSLADAGVRCVTFRGVEPNPHHDTINRAARLAREHDVDMVIGLGGGSVLDAAKGIAAMTAQPEGDDDVWDYVLGGCKRAQLNAALPIVAIPSTAATASEVTPYAVVSNLDVPGKAPLAHECLKPTFALMDPTLTYSMPRHTTADGGADILSHVLENYILGGNDAPFADRHCESIILTVMENLSTAMNTPDHAEARANLFWASTMALSGLHLAGRKPAPFILHAIEHAMSAYQPNLAHGRGLATLFCPYFRWLIHRDRAVDRLTKLGDRIFGVDDPNYFVDRFQAWLRQNELQQSIVDCGIRPEDMHPIADYACRTYGEDGVLDAHGPMTPEDIVEILESTQRIHAAA
jgi:alcohol dehydrogenase YqhD (iron-dependent ADH family)